MTVSSATQKVQYNGNGSTTVFAYTFKVFNQNDLTVIVRSADGTETVKTITTHYTVSGVGGAGGGNVTMLTAPASGQTLTILREQDLVQELDLVENDPFPAQSLEDALDKLTFTVQQHSEELDRAIKASRTNTITSTEFTVSAASRANKIFAFDSAGELAVTQELGTYRGNWATATAFAQRDIVKDTSNNNIYIVVTAHTSTGSQPISSNADVAKWALIVDAASATTSASAASGSASAAASSASAAATSATNAANSATSASTSASTATTQATNAAASAASAAASFDAFDDIYLGSKSSDPSVDNDGNALTVGDQYFNSVANELRVWNGTTWQAASTVGGTVSSLAVTGVASFADGTAAAPSIAHTGDLNAGIFFPAADTVALSTAGNERLRISSDGLVGIGGASSGPKLAVTAAANSSSLVLTDATQSTLTIKHEATNLLTYETGGAAVQRWVLNGVERMRIEGSGNVGIGTSSPTGKLQVAGGNVIINDSATNTALYFSRAEGTLASPTQITTAAILAVQVFSGLDNTSTYRDVAQIRAVTDGAITSTSSPGYLAFRTTLPGTVATAEAMRITSAGLVGIGTSSPITPLHVEGASITTGVSYKAQAQPTSKAAAATLTIAELLGGIIQYTGAVATLTLPTGTLIEGGLPATFPSGMSFDVSFINTGAALLTIGNAASGLTLLGSMTVASGTSGILRFRKSSANNYNVYRVA